jgi:hypothetical protein
MNICEYLQGDGPIDRLARLAMATVILLAGYLFTNDWLAWVLYAVSLVLAVSAIVGFRGICAVRTARARKKARVVRVRKKKRRR